MKLLRKLENEVSHLGDKLEEEIRGNAEKDKLIETLSSVNKNLNADLNPIRIFLVFVLVA